MSAPECLLEGGRCVELTAALVTADDAESSRVLDAFVVHQVLANAFRRYAAASSGGLWERKARS